MHREPKQFVASVKQQYPEYFTGKKVLEVGSLDINGSAREFFTDCDYTGIDLGAGKGVDQIDHVTNLTAFDRWWDVIISTETLEHDARWDESLKAMYRLLRPNGLLVITCAAPNRPEHGTTRTGSAEASPFTSDYYRNISVEDFASVLPANLFSKSYLGYRGNMDDLYFAGIKFSTSQDPLVALINMSESERIFQPLKSTLTVTAEVCTKDRPTTLPMTVSAILNQTHKPNRLVIYNDGEQTSLEETQPLNGLLRMAQDMGINWTVYATPKQGQVKCHQHALEDAQTDLIWRVDDDEIPEPNCLENLLAEMKDEVGAVGGLVHHPNGVSPLPDWVDGSLNDVTKGVNMSWYQFNGGPREVQHLYSTFIFRVDAARKAGGYCMNLSPAGHREETMFSHNIKRAGYKLLVTPNAKTHHLRHDTGGIRSFSDGSLWQHDELIFQEYLRTVGHTSDGQHLIIADMGLGDELCFRAVFVDYIRRKFPDRHYTFAVCHPEVYEGLSNVKIISIAEAKLIVGDKYEDYSLFAWCWKNDWKGSIVDAMKEFYVRF